MAIIFAEDKGTGGLQKLQVSEDEFKKLTKDEQNTIEESPSFTSKEMMMGDSKGTVPDDGKIGVDGGNALVNQVNNKKDDDGGDDEKKSGFKQFVSSVGDALTGFTKSIDKKMENVYNDREKRQQFLSGLNTIISASSYTPIGQAKSPIGMFAEGQKKGFLESEAIEQQREEIKSKSKKAESEALMKNMELLLKQQDIEYQRSQPDSIEADYYKDLRKRNEDINKAVTNEKIFNQMKNITAKQIIESGQLPVGAIYSAIPTSIQAFVDILPEGIRPDTPFLSKIQDEATYLQQMTKLVDNLVLGDIGQLVPVSDKDVEIKRNTYATVRDTPQAFVNAMITQDAINSLNAAKSKYQDTYIGNRSYSKNKRIGFESAFETDGATAYKNNILENSKYSKDDIIKEAQKLGYLPDYDKYTDSKETFYSPFALAEAKASLDLGGKDKWSTVTSTDLGTPKTDVQKPPISEGAQTNEDLLKQSDIPFQTEKEELENVNF